MLVLVVVVYKKKLLDSKTLISLSKQSFISENKICLIIFDNSPVPYIKYEEVVSCLNLNRIDLKFTPENLSLREIYNQVVQEFSGNDFIFLDDDTCLPLNYIDTVCKAMIFQPQIDLFLPMVRVNDKLYSPYKSFFFYSKGFSKLKVGTLKTNFLCAINSGMVIRGRYFKESKFKYPSNTFFYGTDKAFMDVFAKKRKVCYVLDVVLNHDVTVHPSNEDIKSYVNGMINVKSFWLSYYSGRPVMLFSYNIYLFMFVVKQVLTKKSLKYFDILFRS